MNRKTQMPNHILFYLDTLIDIRMGRGPAILLLLFYSMHGQAAFCLGQDANGPSWGIGWSKGGSPPCQTQRRRVEHGQLSAEEGDPCDMLYNNDDPPS